MKPLHGHTSPETAFMVQDYPYGGKRCRIRFWLESHPKKGYRFCSQTEHPTRLVWNAPKKSTYSLLAGQMYQDEQDHVQWDSVTEYTQAEQVLAFLTRFPEYQETRLLAWCLQKQAYCGVGKDGKLIWTINGVPQEVTEAEKERYRADAEVWAGCVQRLRQNRKDKKEVDSSESI